MKSLLLTCGARSQNSVEYQILGNVTIEIQVFIFKRFISFFFFKLKLFLQIKWISKKFSFFQKHLIVSETFLRPFVGKMGLASSTSSSDIVYWSTDCTKLFLKVCNCNKNRCFLFLAKGQQCDFERCHITRKVKYSFGLKSHNI